jgi:hypothetical protein
MAFHLYHWSIFSSVYVTAGFWKTLSGSQVAFGTIFRGHRPIRKPGTSFLKRVTGKQKLSFQFSPQKVSQKL